MEIRTGQTTRLADKYIQQLFTKGKIQVRNHYSERLSDNDHLFGIIIKRLFDEHFHGGQRDSLIVNNGLHQISIKDFPTPKAQTVYNIKHYQQLRKSFVETLSPFKWWVCRMLGITPSLKANFEIAITMEDEIENNLLNAVIFFGNLQCRVVSKTADTLIVRNTDPVADWYGSTQFVVISSSYAE